MDHDAAVTSAQVDDVACASNFTGGRAPQARGLRLVPLDQGLYTWRKSGGKVEQSMLRILVVCVGNICRSPMAVAVLRRELAGMDVSIESAGLAAMIGHPIHADASEALGAHDLSLDEHVACQVDGKQIEQADLVLAMEKRHVAAILAMHPEARRKTFLLGKWEGNAEIADPYRRGSEDFRSAYEAIQRAARSWKNRLEQKTSPIR